MHRRRLLTALAGSGVAGLAGCNRPGTTDEPTGGDSTSDGTPNGTAAGTPTDGSGAGGVYVQSFVERMVSAGTATAGPCRVALFYTVPHRFWTVTNDEASPVPRGETDEGTRVHLMAVVWDPESGTVIPETGLSLELNRGGQLQATEVIYPMLSQRMGVHYGGNFTIPTDGTYAATVDVGALGIRRTGAFAGRFAEPAAAEIEFSVTERDRRRLRTTEVSQAGDPGAVEPMDPASVGAAFPLGRAPAPDALPGRHLGTARHDDAVFEVVRTADPPAGVDGDGPYVAVSARTPYNGYVLPAMTLSVGLGDSRTRLARTLDPDLGYHYGATVSGLSAVDGLALTVETPPQIGRHEGYERAFLSTGSTELSV